MAENLARIIGSEDDKVNCPFYFKNGACRYGNRCTRQHIKPTKSVTLLFAHMYQNSPIAVALAEGHRIPDDKLKEVIDQFENFYQEVFLELSQFGEIEELHVLDNLGDHLVGNVYAKFVGEEDAENCKKNISGRSYQGRLVMPEYSPVVDFREGRCRQFDTDSCRRGGFCNFMHMKYVPKELRKAVIKQMYRENPQYLER
jgi:splicing factor U2AF subunit